MKWFTGSIPAAIQEAKDKHVMFVVYITGEDEMSQKMDSVWEDSSVMERVEQAGIVTLKLDAKSETCTQFSMIYPVVCVPCTFFIGENGVPLEVTAGHVEPAAFIDKIQHTISMHRKQLSGIQSPVQITQQSAAQGGASAATTPTEAQPQTEVQTEAQPQTEVQTEVKTEAPAQTESPAAGTIEPSAAQPSSSTSEQPKEEKIKRAKELMEIKKQQKLIEEKEKQKREEQERRKVGQGATKFNQWKADMEAKEIKDQMRKDKEDAKLARERVKQQIARDREERSAKFRKEKEEREAIAVEAKRAKLAEQEADQTKLQQARMENARLQFRLPDGSSITEKFPSSDTLGMARNFLLERISDSFGRSIQLSLSYPKRDFTEADMSQSLLDLNLAPSAAIIVLPGGQMSRSTPGGSSGSGGDGFIWLLLAPLLSLWNFIYNLLFAAPAQPQGAYNNPAQEEQPRPGPSSSSQSPPSHQLGPRPTSARQRPKSSHGVRSRQEGNMHRFTNADDDEDMASWNGNSTQQL